MKTFWQNIKQFVRDEEGVTAIEYALIAALIAVAIIATVQLVGQKIDATFQQIADKLPAAGT